MLLSRRQFAIGTMAAITAPTMAMPAIGQKRFPHVVVIGGGVGGATLARYLANTAPGELVITIVEPNPTYRTCFFQNLQMVGLHGNVSTEHNYRALQSDFGINVVQDRATRVDRAARQLILASGLAIPYDRLVVSPGIDFQSGAIAGYDEAAQKIMPHAWRWDQKIEMIAERVRAMPQGGVFAITAPPLPYRCPPGPYERASMIAYLLRSANPRAKILVIDAKEKFPKQNLFQQAWKRHYGEMISWIPASTHGGVIAVDAQAGQIRCEFESYKVDAACIVPPQRAGAIAFAAEIVDSGGWCPIKAATMQSTLDPNIHVIGDATRAAAMPKSAESAANQARIAADAICAALTTQTPYNPRIANTCWSLVGPNDGVKVGGTFMPDGDKFKSTSSYISTTTDHPTVREVTYRESIDWYRFVTNNMFGRADT